MFRKRKEACNSFWRWQDGRYAQHIYKMASRAIPHFHVTWWQSGSAAELEMAQKGLDQSIGAQSAANGDV